MKVPLARIAHTRSGDKGDTANIGVIALDERHYPILVREATAERVKEFFGELVKGNVERFELPNLGALNFLLYEALGGGGTISLRVDAQGKTLGAALLRMEIEVDDDELEGQPRREGTAPHARPAGKAKRAERGAVPPDRNRLE
jgi:hypothetical protein